MPPRKPISSLPASLSTDRRDDHRTRLVALRDRLTSELVTAPASYLAGIARQLQAVLAELATMADPDAEESKVDAIIRRRNERIARQAEAMGGAS